MFGRIAMNRLVTGIVLATLVFCGKAFALGVDIGPVHAHTKGSTEELKIVIDTIVTDEVSKAVTKLHAHRTDGEDKFQIRVSFSDLDDKTKALIEGTLKTGFSYKAHLEKLEDNWKLLKLRNDKDD
jgi:hypothetical protein